MSSLLLFEEFPDLDGNIPWIPLVNTPTPIKHHVKLEEYLKSETSDTLEVTLILTSLSPVIGSVSEINVIKENLAPVTRKGAPVAISEIPAETSVEKSFKFELEHDRK